MTNIYPGELEIDNERGVIYFHTSDAKAAAQMGSISILRICNLPKPLPEKAIDITHMKGVSFTELGLL